MGSVTNRAVLGLLLWISTLNDLDAKRGKRGSLADFPWTKKIPPEYYDYYQQIEDPGKMLVLFVSNPMRPTWQPYCSGVITSLTTAITAAHCVRKLPQVGVVGITPELQSINGMWFSKSHRFHKKFKVAKEPGKDMGLYIGKGGKDIAWDVKIASLAFENIDDELIADGTNNQHMCFVMGFGKKRNPCKGVNCPLGYFRYRNATVVPLENCQKPHRILDNSTICVRTHAHCRDDIGGPLVCKIGLMKHVVYGIAANNPYPGKGKARYRCSNTLENSVFVRVSHYNEQFRNQFGYTDPDYYREQKALKHFKA